MDKQEIQENDLETFLRDFPQWWKKYGTHCLLILLIIVLSFYLGRWWSGRYKLMLEEAYSRLEQTRSPGPLQDLARQYAHIPGYAGEALLLAAEGLMDDALGTRALFGTDTKPLDPQEQKKKFEQAARLYDEVIRLKGSSLQVLNARLGLAAVQESLSVLEGDRQKAIDEARRQYEQVASSTDWPHLAMQAKNRLETLDRISRPFEMPEPPPPPPAPEAGAGVPDIGPLLLPSEPAAPAPGSGVLLPPAQPVDPAAPAPLSP